MKPLGLLKKLLDAGMLDNLEETETYAMFVISMAQLPTALVTLMSSAW